MNLSIRRQGIVLKTVTVNGDRARIGSGEGCEIQLNDPYLAAHVADLVQKDNQWRIVDAGTSLEGVSRDGARIEDEVLLFGQPYVVGGFEIVPEAATVKASAVSPEAAGAGKRAAPPSATPRGVDPQAIPRTMMAGEVDVPKTMFGGTALPKPMVAGEADVPKTMFGGTAIPKTMMAGQVDVPKTEMADLNEMKRQSSASQQNRPVPSPAPAVVAALPGHPIQATKPPSKKRVLLLGCAAILFVVVMTLVMIIAFSKTKAVTRKPGTATAMTSTSTTTAATATTMSLATTTAASPVVGEVNYDKTLASWEATLDKSPTPELRSRYVRTAFEVGMVYSAAHRATEAAPYLQKVLKYGEPGSKEVLAAKRKLGMQ
ncbi:MAG TPA: FHA domain-containing protein [Thermoanaerobaculia bacterium]|nr:FHA domain-containing protein [Thermoanaerobaculia bacterium]